MTKKEKVIEKLRTIVLDRYEAAGYVLTPDLANQIWYALLGEYDREGYDAAKKYAEEGKIDPTQKSFDILSIYNIYARDEDITKKVKARIREIMLKKAYDPYEYDRPEDEISFFCDLWHIGFDGKGNIIKMDGGA